MSNNLLMKRVSICIIIVLLATMHLHNYRPVQCVASSKQVVLTKKKLSLYVGNTYKFANKGCSWKSSNRRVASVSSKGRIKAKKVGSTKVTAVSKANKSKAVCKVTVGKFATGVNLSSATTILLKAGQTSNIVAAVAPSKVLYRGLKYTSNNRLIARVSNSGVITPTGNGTASITVQSIAKNKAGKKIKKTITVIVSGFTDLDVPVVSTNTPLPDLIDGSSDYNDLVIIPQVTNRPTEKPSVPTEKPIYTQEPGTTAQPTSMPTEVPTVSASPTPVPTPSPTTIAEYINSLVPDDSHPIVGNFLVANANGSLRTVYLLNKNYAGNVKVKFDDYTYSSDITVTNLLKKVQYELASVTNSAGTVNVMRKNSADSWTVEFLQTGVKYYFSGRSKDNIYNSPYGIIIAEGNTLEHIIITTN